MRHYRCCQSDKFPLLIRNVETAKDVPDPVRQEALLSLLDDSSPVVRQALVAHFTDVGSPAVAFLREIAQSPNRMLAGHAAWYLQELKFTDPVAEFRGFIRSLNYELETGALLLARTVSPKLDIGRCCSALDAIARRCRELSIEPSSARDRCRLINRVLFHEWGFRGNIEHYVDPLNSLLDQVIERRKGNPISLSIVYLLIAGRLDFQLEPIGLPGHFLVGCPADDLPFFVDPFDQGLMRDRGEFVALLEARRVNLKPADLAPVPVREVLCRVCRNLVNSYTAAGDTEKARLFASFIEEFEAAYARNAM